jgi:Uma2 family endonuclease
MSNLSIWAIERLPRSVVFDPPLSDEEFEEFCLVTENVRIERTREGVIHVNPPAGDAEGSMSAALQAQLGNWCLAHSRGGMVFDETGFYLTDGSMLSPIASYLGAEKLRFVSPDQLQGFPRLCPDFVIELVSESNSLPAANAKMNRWIENGVTLGWLVSPSERTVYVFNPHPVAKKRAQMRAITGSFVHGTYPVGSFHLDLEEVWDRYKV